MSSDLQQQVPDPQPNEIWEEVRRRGLVVVLPNVELHHQFGQGPNVNPIIDQPVADRLPFAKQQIEAAVQRAAENVQATTQASVQQQPAHTSSVLGLGFWKRKQQPAQPSVVSNKTPDKGPGKNR